MVGHGMRARRAMALRRPHTGRVPCGRATSNSLLSQSQWRRTCACTDSSVTGHWALVTCHCVLLATRLLVGRALRANASQAGNKAHYGHRAAEQFTKRSCPNSCRLPTPLCGKSYWRGAAISIETINLATWPDNHTAIARRRPHHAYVGNGPLTLPVAGVCSTAPGATK